LAQRRTGQTGTADGEEAPSIVWHCVPASLFGISDNVRFLLWK
jgi:hypothetical protein